MAAVPLKSPVRRRHSRYELTCPVEVTVLRSGIPQTLPGRIVDAGLGGISVVLSGDLHPGESTGVEFQLAGAPAMIQARARVRYQDRLRSGLAFSTVSPDKLELLRLWTDQRHRVMISPADTVQVVPPPAPQFLQAAVPKPSRTHKHEASSKAGSRRTKLVAALAAVAAIGLSAWAYEHFVAAPNLAAQAAAHSDSLQRRVIVAADVMQSLITYRSMPVYPADAQRQGVEGTVLLDTVVGKDGRVLEIRPTSGPPELATSASDAVKNWRFSPFTLNGDAVEVETTIAVEFRLKNH